MKKTIVISYDALNIQSEQLASQEIKETLDGLANSLRTQVNNVKFVITDDEPEKKVKK
jgi:hypothetical protein